MLNRIVPKVGLATIAAIIWLAYPAIGGDFYVAPDGKDANPGTADKPFATVARARDAVRQKVAAGLEHDVVVSIRGGVYPQTETLVFGPEDSGTEKYSITYAAVAGERVVLSGGRMITGWKKGEGEIWTVELPEVKAGEWYFHQLFVDGQRAIRARTPNAGVGDWPGGWNLIPGANNSDAHDAIVTLGVNHPIQAWKNLTDVEVIWICNNAATRKRLGSVNEKENTFTLPPPHMWPHGFTGEYNISFPVGGFGCYFENAREFLDTPGEWYLDRQAGILSYRPREGEDLTRAEVVAPLVQNTLLAVRGTQQQPVRNLHFQGIRAAYADWPLPPQGFTGLFGCLQLVEQKEPQGAWKFHWIDAAVSFTYARGCHFIGGAVEHAGSIGLSLLNGCAENVIEGNHLYDLGGGGITAGAIRNRDTWQWADPLDKDDHKNYRIANNHIHDCGIDYYDAVGILVWMTQETVVAHNLIHDIAYSGIVLGGNESPESPYLAKNNTVEYNHVYNVMQVANDGAAIYVSFPQADRGALIRGNLFHDIARPNYRLGIYLDTVGVPHGCAGYHFEGNVVFHCEIPMSLGVKNSEENRCIDNLLYKGDGPAAEFIKAFQTQAGLEPAYRRQLVGIIEPPCQFYRLTEYSHAVNIWSAQQYHWPERDGGVVQVFRRSESREDSQHIQLRSLDADARYEVKNLGTETTSQHSGRELMGEGFPVTLSDPSPTHLDDGSWHHIAVTHDGTGMQTYVDGVAEGLFVPMSPGPASSHPAPFGIGASPSLGRYFTGAIDEVAVFNTALSKEAILFIKNNGVADYDPNAGLAGFWDFEEVSGVLAHDRTVHQNHGTLQNFDFASASVSDRFGNSGGALRFNGTNTLINCGNNPSLDITNQITILAWVKPEGVQPSFSTVVDKEELSRGGYTLMVDGSSVLSYMCNGGPWIRSGGHDEFSLEPISTTTIEYQRIQKDKEQNEM